MRKLSTLVPFGHRRRSRRCSLESFQNCNSKLFCLNITKIKYSLEAFQDSNFQDCKSKQFCLSITNIRLSILFYLSRGEESVPQTPFRIAFINCFFLNISKIKCPLNSFLGLKFQTLFHLNFTRIIENINLQGIFFPKNQPKLYLLVPIEHRRRQLYVISLKYAPVRMENF